MDQITFTVIVVGAMMIAYYGGRWLLMRELEHRHLKAQHIAQQIATAIAESQLKHNSEAEWEEAFEQHGDGDEWADPQLELWAEEDLEALQHKDL